MDKPAHVVVLATLTTKSEETKFLVDRLSEHGVNSTVLDTSLGNGGKRLDGVEKLRAMDDAVANALAAISAELEGGVNAIVGLGGGTGGEIGLRIMRGLPITFPKVLVTTLPFDPRIAIADSSIILVPTLADLAGLNATLREILENTAAMTAGLCTTRREARSCVINPSVGVTSLGATEDAITQLIAALRENNEESTVFHANGYGGAAFQRFAERGAFRSIVDLTPHELTRIHLAGAHVDMPSRFTAAGDLPRVVLPGALNFIGLGEISLVASEFLHRPHYEHSGFFTHVKVTLAEMAALADRLVEHLNSLTGPTHLIVPMGGFSHHDRPGGAIEDQDLRSVFLDRVKSRLSKRVQLEAVDSHISDPSVTQAIMDARAAQSEIDRISANV